MVATQNGLLYVYDVSEVEGGDCKLIVKHDLRNVDTQPIKIQGNSKGKSFYDWFFFVWMTRISVTYDMTNLSFEFEWKANKLTIIIRFKTEILLLNSLMFFCHFIKYYLFNTYSNGIKPIATWLKLNSHKKLCDWFDLFLLLCK